MISLLSLLAVFGRTDLSGLRWGNDRGRYDDPRNW
jgi:hypothetical protein